jgi:hypothetical protein
MEYKMGGACGPWGGKRMHTRIWLCGENKKKKEHLKNTEIGG